MVDAGTIELVRGAGAKVVSSADLVQKYEACWTPQQLESHLAAGEVIDRVIRGAFAGSGEARPREREVQRIRSAAVDLAAIRCRGNQSRRGPDVAVNANASDPHYGPVAGKAAPIREGDLLLLDVWGKTKDANSVYYDVTWMGYLGAKVPDKYAKGFSRSARCTRQGRGSDSQPASPRGSPLQGWQVDKAARDIIDKAGYGKYFFHRLGHNIGETVHGNGANMDNLETHDVRHLIPNTCTSVEPGIYLPEFGMRTEVNVYIDEHEARVTGAVQREILRAAGVSGQFEVRRATAKGEFHRLHPSNDRSLIPP